MLFFLYKNILLAGTMAWVCRHGGYSGYSLYDGNVASNFNGIFTCFPVFVLGVLDRDVRSEQAMAHPQLYRLTQMGLEFNTSNLLLMAADALLHSIVLFYGALYIYTVEDPAGREVTVGEFGLIVFSLVHVMVAPAVPAPAALTAAAAFGRSRVPSPRPTSSQPSGVVTAAAANSTLAT